MHLIDRYLFRQLLWPTIGVASALGAVALLSQTLYEIDVLVKEHQSIFTFLTLVGLTLPQMLVMVLPIALFVAALMVLNRLHTEQEIVVCYAGGLSRWRVISPGLRLAVLCTLLSLALNLWAEPWCYRQTRVELYKIKADLVATLVRDGQFTQPSPNLTVYAQSTDRQGLLHNVFIEEMKGKGGSTTFAAKFGRIAKTASHPALVLMQGSNQHFDAQGVLQYVAFDEYVFDLTPYVNNDEELHYKNSDRYLHELLFPDLTQYWDRKDRKQFLAEAHARLATPLYNIAFMTLAMSGVLGGAFSRTGYARRIGYACAAAAIVRILGFGAQSACAAAPALNFLQYLIPLAPTAVALRQLLGTRVARPTPVAPAGSLRPIGAA